MKTYKIKHLESNSIVGEVNSDAISPGENGVVLFLTEAANKVVAIAQISSSILIFEDQTLHPALVVPFTEVIEKA